MNQENILEGFWRKNSTRVTSQNEHRETNYILYDFCFLERYTFVFEKS